MENPKKTLIPASSDSQGGAKLIQWEDFDQELSRLCSLSSALKEAQANRLSLKEKLEPLVQVQAESLSRLNKIAEMRQKLEARKLLMGKVLNSSQCASSDAKKKEEQLSDGVRSLLVAGTNLSVASKKLQESNKLLTGEKGHLKLSSLQKMLRKRQQYMVSQISFLYPVKASIGPGHELELECFPGSSRSGDFAGSKPVNQGALSILGLQLTMLPFTKLSFFTDKEVVQKSATALGYVAHVVSLIASYLEVPLRYPLHLGGSRSFIKDLAHSIEPNSYDSASNSLLFTNSTNLKSIEFPLFLEGQETTRAAYAVFLLSKDLEQLLNFIGERSLGPRHVLANLRELLRTIMSPDYVHRDDLIF